MMQTGIVLLACWMIAATAFCPRVAVTTITTTTKSTSFSLQLYAKPCPRRDVLMAGLTAGLVASGAPEIVNAKAASTFFFDENIEQVREPSQMPTGGKIDLNAAFVDEYMQFRGMYPHAAGQIASHGPYESVKDIYKIPSLTENDVVLFKKYENAFTVNPPGRAFKERINARVST